MSKQTMKQALDALQSCTYDDEGYCLIPDNEDAITALRQAIDAEPTIKQTLTVQEQSTELDAEKLHNYLAPFRAS